MSIDSAAFLAYIRSLPSYQNQVVHVQSIPPRKHHYGELTKPLSTAIENRLRERGLFPLYSHQTQALDLIRQGKNVIIATASASGKSLGYNLALLEARGSQRLSGALYLFPTKALAQDQERALRELASPDLLPPEEEATYDGDTPSEERARIRRQAQLVLTNPDMLHVGILPHHLQWSRFFRNLRFVVVDEAHTYRGVFGSHVAQVLRRLRRVCALYGAKPQFILASATLANPQEHAQNLVGLPCELVAEDGSPFGGKDFILWNPPLLGSTGRRSPNTEASFLLSELLTQGIRSLAFAPSRRLTELINIYTRNKLEQQPSLAAKVKPYRAGYLPEVRRQIERELFSGELLGVVATTALELGVDIGHLDATILTGYPGSIASTWQQAGRSGRSGEYSLSFLIARDNPLDQYLMHHPQALFDKGVENALVNTRNRYILKPHLLCAAWEIPLRAGDEAIFGPSFSALKSELEAEGFLRPRGSQSYLSPSAAYPAQDINLRATTEKSYALMDARNGSLLETVEASVALLQVHPGAIYLHQGESYLVTRLDLSERIAWAQPAEADYYTQPRELNNLHILRLVQQKEVGHTLVCLGEVEVTLQVIGFRKKRQLSEEVIGEEALDLPTYTFPTMALWFDLPPHVEERLSRQGLDLAGGLHGLEHAAIALLPLFALCDRHDIGGLSHRAHPDTGKTQVFIYDAYPGGVGIAEKGYELIQGLWQATLDAIIACPCQEGCPSCIQSPKCGNNNETLDKKAAHFILAELTRPLASKAKA